MSFQLQPAPRTRHLNKNKVSPPRTPRSHSRTSSLSNSEEGSNSSQDEGQDTEKSSFQSSSRFQEHFSWGNIPGTASLGKPGVPAFTPMDPMPKRKTSRLYQREKLEVPALILDGTSGSETEVDSEVETFFKGTEDQTRPLSTLDRRYSSAGSIELEYQEEDITPGSTPVPLMISPRSPRNGSHQATVPTSISNSSSHSGRESLKSLNEGFNFLSKEEADRALLNARLSASAGSVATSRRRGETSTWNRQSFTSATKSPTSNRGSLVRRRSSVKSPTSAEIQILSFGEQQQQEGQELHFTTPRYDRPSSNFLSLPSPSTGSRRHTSLQFPSMSPISPRSAAAQHSPSTLAPPTSQVQHQHLSIGTTPLSATLLALGVNREAQYYTRGGEDSSPFDDDEGNPRWSVPFWARRSGVLEQQAAVEKNRKAIAEGGGLPRTTIPGQHTFSPNGSIFEMGNVTSSAPQVTEAQTSTRSFLEVPRPIKQRGAIESTVRAGRLAASRFRDSLASYISGNGSTSGSQTGPGWRGALPYKASSPPSLPTQSDSSQSDSAKGRNDGWGGSRATWFPSSILGPLTSPAPKFKSSPRLKSLHLASSSTSNSVGDGKDGRTRPNLRVHFAPLEVDKTSDEDGNEDDWVDDDDTQDLLPSPRQSRSLSASSSPFSKFNKTFGASNLFRRRSSGGSPGSPTSTLKFTPPPPTSFNNGLPTGFPSSTVGKKVPQAGGVIEAERSSKEGTPVTYRDGSAEGRPFDSLQQVRNRRKKTALKRMGLGLGITTFLVLLINVIVLDFKLLPVKDNHVSSSNTQAPSDLLSSSELSLSVTPLVAITSISPTPTVSPLPSDSVNDFASSTTLSSSPLSSSSTPAAESSVSESLLSPVTVAAQLSGAEKYRILGRIQ